MDFLKHIKILELFWCSALEFFDVGSCAKGFGEFAEEKDGFDIWGGLIVSDGFGDGGFHLVGECIEVWGWVEIDVSYFILDFGLYFVELDASV